MLTRISMLLTAAAVLVSCDTVSSDKPCALGSTRSCVGVNGCFGSHACMASGASATRWSTCQCSGPQRTADAGTAAGSSPDASTPKPRLGTACKSDHECAAGAFCLTTHSDRLFGGAPVEPSCVADCSQASRVCDDFADAVCVRVDASPAAGDDAGVPASALCFERCALGASTAPKCHGRAHTACAPLDDQAAADGGYCRPLCSSDAECGSGACDAAHGVCEPNAPRDTRFGTGCDASALQPGCEGVCVRLAPSVALCSSPCVFGASTECAPASGGLRRGACLFPTPGGNIGDLGYCGELCDCSDDCSDPSLICDAFDDATLERSFQRKGACTDPKLALHQTLACGR